MSHDPYTCQKHEICKKFQIQVKFLDWFMVACIVLGSLLVYLILSGTL